MAKKKRWIQEAVSEPGAFTAKAEKAGMSVQAYARKQKKAPGKLGKQARLALTLKKLSQKKKR
jgi:hypothetical protein